MFLSKERATVILYIELNKYGVHQPRPTGRRNS